MVLAGLGPNRDRVGDTESEAGLALLIHGDAAFAGEGVVQGNAQLEQARCLQGRGRLHVVVNNQIGFTTSPSEYRSSVYATDVAKMLQAPIFHVNGEDPEAVAQVVRLALDYRREFQRDVIIDMYGYRRLGHNEGDEPSFTQPVLYRAIERRKSVREGYLDHLLKLGGLSRQEADSIAVQRREQLEKALSESTSDDYRPGQDALRGLWSGYKGGPATETPEVSTSLETKTWRLLAAQLRLPANFSLHPKLKRDISSPQSDG